MYKVPLSAESSTLYRTFCKLARCGINFNSAQREGGLRSPHSVSLNYPGQFKCLECGNICVLYEPFGLNIWNSHIVRIRSWILMMFKGRIWIWIIYTRNSRCTVLPHVIFTLTLSCRAEGTGHQAFKTKFPCRSERNSAFGTRTRDRPRASSWTR
jgi:hypothetical protein